MWPWLVAAAHLVLGHYFIIITPNFHMYIMEISNNKFKRLLNVYVSIHLVSIIIDLIGIQVAEYPESKN